MEIFAVNVGSYGDYGPVAMFTNKVEADALAGKLRGEVVTWKADPDLSGLKPFGRWITLSCAPGQTFYGDDNLKIDGVDFARESDEAYLSDIENREDYDPPSIADSLRTSVDQFRFDPKGPEIMMKTYVQAWGKTQEDADALAEANLAEAIRMLTSPSPTPSNTPMESDPE